MHTFNSCVCLKLTLLVIIMRKDINLLGNKDTECVQLISIPANFSAFEGEFLFLVLPTIFLSENKIFCVL